MLLCNAKLGLKAADARAGGSGRDDGNTGAGAGDLGLASAVKHLASAVATSSQAVAEPPASVTEYSSWRAAHGRAAGHALAFLLHPCAPQLAGGPTEEARSVFGRSAAVLASPTPAPGGSSSSAAAQRQQRQADWQERAKRSPALQKLLALTGLGPVKQAMFQLADLVRGG